MPRVASYLKKDVIENIKKLYHNGDKSLSMMIAELIDIGYRVKQHHETQQTQKIDLVEEEVKSDLADNHTEYLLRIMAMLADCYRCVRNDKSKYEENDAEVVLTKITSNAQNYIDEKLGKS